MSNRPVIPQPRPSRPPSNFGWTIPVLVVEIILMGVVLLWIKK
jgi:type IV secretory pathway VirB3-like protein